jgi:hypothetical protein
MPTPEEIVRGIAQAAANAYDGSHSERYSLHADYEGKKIGLRREQGDAILDSRMMDGFQVKFEGPRLRVLYHSQANLKEVHANGFENEYISTLKDIAKYLKKEYKKITGNSLSLKEEGEPLVEVEVISRRRTDVRAIQWYNIGGMDDTELVRGGTPKDRLDSAVKDWLSIGKDKYAGAKKPSNVTRKGKQ